MRLRWAKSISTFFRRRIEIAYCLVFTPLMPVNRHCPAVNIAGNLSGMRGFVSDDLMGAFLEFEAISRGTKCKQHLFSLSLNPPKDADVSEQEIEDAVSRAETALGLQDQPRAIVFHEKCGADGLSCVWRHWLNWFEHRRNRVRTRFCRDFAFVGLRVCAGCRSGRTNAPLLRKEGIMSVRFKHRPKDYLIGTLFTGGTGYFGFWVLFNNPTEEAVMWGFVSLGMAGLGLWSLLRGWP